MAACLRGDDAAWTTLLDRYAGLIYSVALGRGVDPTLADDVFQSVSLTLWQRLHVLRNPATLPKWLMVTTARRTLALQRKHDRPPAATEPSAPDPAITPQDAVLQAETDLAVELALAELPTRDRELLADFFERGLSYAEIADRHGLAVGSLGPLRARALTRLRTILQRRGVA